MANSARQSTGLLFAYVLGVWVNAFSNPDVKDFGTAFLQIYDVTNRPVAWLVVVPSIVLIILPMLRVILQRSLRRASFAVSVSEVMSGALDDDIADFARGRIAWGQQVVLQNAPRIEEGWAPDEIEIKRIPNRMKYVPPSQEEFESWRDKPENKYIRDGTSLRVTQDPIAFTDDNRLRLEVQPVRFVDAMFYNRTQASTASERSKQLRNVLLSSDPAIQFPHSCCLHAVVCTADGWVLLTQRSPKVAFHPGSWSCSIEEQLSERDFEGTGGSIARRWALRMLNEELGLTDSETLDADIRYLALFIEGNNLNISLIGLVTLSQNRDYVDSVISGRPRQDYEFANWRFVRWSVLAEELATPSLDYHPSSGLRMFMAGIVRYGVYEFGVRISKEAFRKRGKRTKKRPSIVPDLPPGE